MKKIPAILLAMMILTLSACGCSHEWQGASCTEPDTCTKCGETRGEALEHDFSEATYWQGETCIYCGETQGRALTPEFLNQGYSCIDMSDLSPINIYINESGTANINARYFRTCTSVNDNEEATVFIGGKGIETFPYDDEHAPVEGYDWTVAEFEFACFGDKGAKWWEACGDFYVGLDGTTPISVDGGKTTIQWKETDYPECTIKESYGETIWDYFEVNGESAFAPWGFNVTLKIEALLPAGYDGLIVAFCQYPTDDGDPAWSDLVDDGTLFVRLK